MLEICTKDTPFRCPSGQLYRQVDGVAMGSPLGVLFAEAYMAHIESAAISSMNTPPHTYCRYVDDIFVDMDDEVHLASLKMALEEHSVLRFTTELSINGKMPFLDVHIDASDKSFTTSVFRKPTDPGRCMSGDSECPDKYKESVIRAYINRAIKHCSTWPLLHQELQRVRQLLVNNRYTHTDIDKCIRRQLHIHYDRTEERGKESRTQLKLYYKSSMSTAYKIDEKILRNIVLKHCAPSNSNDQIKLLIYYKNRSVSSLVMSNNLSRDTSILKATNIVYEFKCPIGDCARRSNSSYIGHTTTTLSRRITMHLQSGAPDKHVTSTHNQPLTRRMMVENISVLTKCSNKQKLMILEAVYIRDRDPLINRQLDMRGTLSLYDGRPLLPRI